MKKMLLFTAVAAAVMMAGCKTTEANYRAAYEKAKAKGQSTAVDAEVYEQIAKEEGPATLTFGEVSFPGRGQWLLAVDLSDVPAGKVKKFSVVNGKFRQQFNARSMTKRLREAGFDSAFVARDRETNYYSVAASVDNATEAAVILDSLKIKGKGAIAPFPYIIVK